MNKLSKILLSSITASALMSTAYAAPSASSTTSMTDAQLMENASYIIGYSIAKNITAELQSQNISLNNQELKQGFDTGVDGYKPRLTDEQMQQALVQFQQTQQQASN